MARRKRASRPSDPLEIARRRLAERQRQNDPVTWGVALEAVRLPANAAVEISADRAGRVVRVRRNDVFAILHGRGKLSPRAHEAVRRLQDDIAILHRTCRGGGDFTPRVDASRRPDDFTQARARAGARIDAALRLSGAASARLLAALCESDVVLGRAADWRAVVLRETGEGLADAQGAILRAACENVAGAYATLDRAPRPQVPSPLAGEGGPRSGSDEGSTAF
jgi:hypothetical protein